MNRFLDGNWLNQPERSAEELVFALGLAQEINEEIQTVLNQRFSGWKSQFNMDANFTNLNAQDIELARVISRIKSVDISKAALIVQKADKELRNGWRNNRSIHYAILLLRSEQRKVSLYRDSDCSPQILTAINYEKAKFAQYIEESKAELESILNINLLSE